MQGIPTPTPESIGAATTALYSVTVAPGDWSGSDPSTAAKTIAGILATDTPIVDLDLSSVLFADWADVQADWTLVSRAATSTDTVTFYATSTPTESLPIQIQVVR
jgi:type 1 glutamine amidotransferase